MSGPATKEREARERARRGASAATSGSGNASAGPEARQKSLGGTAPAQGRAEELHDACRDGFSRQAACASATDLWGKGSGERGDHPPCPCSDAMQDFMDEA